MRQSLHRLSPREREVLRLLAAGLSNKEIAAGLLPPCSVETVKTHLRQIYSVLDVPNRAAAAAVWAGARSAEENQG